MTLVQSAAGRLAAALGRESRLIRGLRPAYETALNWASVGRGIKWSLNGVACRIDARQRRSMSRVYEPEVAAFLAARIKPGSVCLDIGANVGIYVIQLAHWSLPDGKVHAFEPNPGAEKVLRHHVRINDLTNRVIVVPRAVAKASGSAILHAHGTNGMSRLKDPNPLLADRTTAHDVHATSIDEYCREQAITPDWILIDIEGFEVDALQGAKETITRQGRSPELVVEMHPSAWQSASTNRDAAEALVNGLGRRAVPITGQVDPFAQHGAVHLEKRQ